jgi:hypothetical protein
LTFHATQATREAFGENVLIAMEKLLAVLMAASEAAWLIAIGLTGWWALRASF